MRPTAPARDLSPPNAAALLLKGQLLVSRKEFAAAAKVLDRYVNLRPDDGHAAKLAQLCAVPDTDAPDVHEAMGNLLVLQKQERLAIGLFQRNEKRLAVYQKQIEAAWPKMGGWLKPDKDFKLVFSAGGTTWNRFKATDLTPLQGTPISSLTIHSLKTRDLGPLRGMPLRRLTLSSNKIKDLTPLEGMMLQELNIGATAVADLQPLAGMPLTILHAASTKVRDLTPLEGMNLEVIGLPRPYKVLQGLELLRNMASLQRINTYSAEEFWKKLDAGEIK